MRKSLLFCWILAGCGATPATSPTTSVASSAPATASASSTSPVSSAPVASANTAPTASPTASAVPPKPTAPPDEWTPARYVAELNKAQKNDGASREQMGRIALTTLSELAEKRDPGYSKVAKAIVHDSFDPSQKARVAISYVTEAPGSTIIDAACGAKVSEALGKLKPPQARDLVLKALAPCKIEKRFGLSSAEVAKVPLGPLILSIAGLEALAKTSKDPASEAQIAKWAIWAASEPKLRSRLGGFF